MKKIILCLFVTLISVPFIAQAKATLQPPNLVEVRVNGKFVDKKSIIFYQGSQLDLIGTAKPLSQVYLYLGNEQPSLSKIKVDTKGNWQYSLNIEPSIGKYNISGEVHDGKTISKRVDLTKLNVLPTKQNTTIYIIIIGILILVLATLLVLKYRRKKDIAGV